MRKILFRGKRISDGKWSESVCPHGEMHSGTVLYDYDLNTVGEYTGLTDKNGKKIFEGDIVNVPFFTPPNMCIAFIEGAFCLANKDGEYVADIHYIHHAGIECTEVIGNIFDNPELLTED